MDNRIESLKHENQKNQRRRRDSNPRYGFPHAGFQDRCIKPALPLLLVYLLEVLASIAVANVVYVCRKCNKEPSIFFNQNEEMLTLDLRRLTDELYRNYFDFNGF